MAYTDLSSTWAYKSLITHQLLDQHAENDKVFYDLLFGSTDIANDVKFDNAKYIKAEIAAGSTYRKLIGLDASNIIQIGESGVEVRIPADPTNALGVATKQYVDAIQMFQDQAEVSVATLSGSLVTLLSLSATTRGVLKALWVARSSTTAGTCRVKITVDGTVVIDETSDSIGAGVHRYLTAQGLWNATDVTAEGNAGALANIFFNSTLLVEVLHAGGGAGTSTFYARYAKVP